jgi:hypothetical protein
MICLAEFLCNYQYIRGKLDVKGVFIQIEMSDLPVYMYIRCTGKLRDLYNKKGIEWNPGFLEKMEQV